MALILNIDTATEAASIALSNDGRVVGLMNNPNIKDHASWIHQAIQDLLRKSGFVLSQLDAVAVTAGPGSYTGLRVGMATAKGLCYILQVPLILENTLKVMVRAFIDRMRETRNLEPETLLIPMIDARRMEVFTAVYDLNLNEKIPPLALVLNKESFCEIKAGQRLICFGSGNKKFKTLVEPREVEFLEDIHDAGSLGLLSYRKFVDKEYADLAYAEPLYLKEFHSTAKRQ